MDGEVLMISGYISLRSPAHPVLRIRYALPISMVSFKKAPKYAVLPILLTNLLPSFFTLA
jgi:hypothetical protein